MIRMKLFPNYRCACSLLYSLLLLVLMAPPALALNTSSDFQALLSFKSFITSDPSNSLDSWRANSTTVCDGWRGVSCDLRNRRVVAIDLQSLRLTGSITPHIGNISFLRQLHLQNNQLVGSLPKEIGHLFRLRSLNVSSNFIEGGIPEDITGCRQLIMLDMLSNRLTGSIPNQLSLLSRLQVLRLGQNLLTGTIPPSIANITSLTTLHLGTNSLNGSIPPDLGRFPKLQHLQFSSNELSGTIPDSLYNISTIITFVVADNHLHGRIPSDIGLRLPNVELLNLCINPLTGPIPSTLINATKLTNIRLSHNFLEGTVPLGLGNLKELIFFNIGFNRLTGEGETGLEFLTSLANCTKLEWFAADENLFHGVLPASVSNLSTHLSKFYMGGNRLHGSIPVGIGNLIGLTLLNLTGNSLSGSIPSEIVRLKNLQSLSLAKNMLSGTIPDSLGGLTKLNHLDLHGNNLTGTIPSGLGFFKQLLSLDLSRNQLEGSIPKEVSSLSSLGLYLNLSHNLLSGPLPVEVGELDKTVAIDVSKNHLSGIIPATIGNCDGLQYIFLHDNSFTGTIPDSLGDIKGLQILDLSSNHLSGAIPMSLQSSKYLQYLNLSFNNLEGEVPNEGVFANITKQELQGNMRLCSKITSKWQLPSCHLSSSQGMSLVLKVTIAVAGFTFLIVLLGLAYILFYRKSKPVKVASSESFRAVHKRVSYEELSVATDKFNPTNFLGGGGFGSVFKGCLRDGTVVAVKVLNLEKHGASKSFFVECDALRSIRHRNLVKLITSCLSTDFNNTDFKALVYEFMPNGSLEEWLHPPENSSHGIQLDLSQRLNIAIDVASALDYLHNDCSTPIVHRDLKPSNVLLDQDMTARVGDFGLARLQDTEPSDCHQSTTFNLKGTIGYIAPEYGISGMTSTKADVFSFGVLLLELFTRKKPTDDMFTGEVSLPKWVSVMFPHRILDILDPELLNPISNGMASIRPKDEESWKFCIISLFEICLACTSESLEKRMNIRDVLPKLKKIRDNQFQC